MAPARIINLLDFSRNRLVRRMLRGKVLRQRAAEELLSAPHLRNEVLVALADESTVRDYPDEWRLLVGEMVTAVLAEKDQKLRRVARDVVERHGLSEPPGLLDALIQANAFGTLAAVTGDRAIASLMAAVPPASRERHHGDYLGSTVRKRLATHDNAGLGRSLGRLLVHLGRRFDEHARKAAHAMVDLELAVLAALEKNHLLDAAGAWLLTEPEERAALDLGNTSAGLDAAVEALRQCPKIHELMHRGDEKDKERDQAIGHGYRGHAEACESNSRELGSEVDRRIDGFRKRLRRHFSKDAVSTFLWEMKRGHRGRG